MDQTTPYGRNTIAVVRYFMPAALALSVGTGGVLTKEAYLNWQSKLLLAPANPSLDKNAVNVASVAEDVQYIRSALKMTVAEIAECAGVTRQSLYNWMGGAAIKPENEARFTNLKRAADVISGSGIALTGLHVKRKLPNGKSLKEAISTGQEGASVAATFVSMLRSEAAQRSKLASRFVGRAPIDSHDDASPIFNE